MRVLTVQLMFKLPLAMTVSAWRTVSTAPAVPAALNAVLQPGDTVVIANLRFYDASRLTRYRQHLLDLYSMIATHNASMIHLSDVPLYRGDNLCLLARWPLPVWWYATICSECGLPLGRSREEIPSVDEWYGMVSNLLQPLHYAHTLDIHDQFCDLEARVCRVYIPATAIVGYRDLTHLNDEGSFAFWPWLRRAWPLDARQQREVAARGAGNHDREERLARLRRYTMRGWYYTRHKDGLL